MGCSKLRFVTIFLLGVTVCGAVNDVHIYVSQHGSDQNDGYSDKSPVKTLDRALSQAWHVNINTTVIIEIMPGYYEMDQSIRISRSNTVVRSYRGTKVHVLGGRRIPNNALKKVSDPSMLARLPLVARGHVYFVHLPDLNITNYGMLKPYGSGIHRLAPLEVFYNGNPLRLSQWPNQDFINIVSTPDGQNGKRFRYRSSIPQSWAHEEEPWVYGFWYWSWSDRSIKVTSLDTSSMTVSLAEPALYGLRPGHWEDRHGGWGKQGGYFRFINILSALDQPGEYYVDKKQGNLYVWLPNGVPKQSDRLDVSLVNDCILINSHVHDVVIEDFTLEACRGYGIHGSNSKNVQINKMEIKNTGGIAAYLSGDSRNSQVSSCYIHDTDGGIYVQGGNRNTLESSGNVISNNDVFRFSRVGAVGVDGINILGVGHLVRHNHIRNGQYNGIKFYGNDLIMEFNMLEYLCMNASDCGAFHTGRDWTTRGNVIQYNIVHDTLRRVPGNPCRAVMLDDQSSSTSIMYNVFYHNDVHVNIGGGRDNVVFNNVIYNAKSYNLEVDNRGINHEFDKDLYQHLHNVPYKSSVWTLHYPDMINFDSQDKSLPEGNQIRKNVLFNGPTTEFIHGHHDVVKNVKFYNITEVDFALGPVDFYDVTRGDFRVKCDAAEWANKVNFRQVPSPNDVGPTLPSGPTFLRRRLHSVQTTAAPTPCTTKAPATSWPVPAYLPDGSRPNTLYNIKGEGCWLSVSGCTNHPHGVGTYRDTYGEKYEYAGDNETRCFRRAVITWKYCGGRPNEQVAAIYAPSGAMTLAGDGCFAASYGCPKHGGPADGHALANGKLERAVWVEQHVDGARNETQCLTFALRQWRYCGSSPNHPFTFIYRPTGSVVTAGAGCWIHVQKCPKHPEYKSMFYDAWGATNYDTDNDELVCLNQSEYYWTLCGRDGRYPVTAYYRPTTASKTFP